MDHTFRGGSGSVGWPGGNGGEVNAPRHGVSVTFPVGNARTHRDSPAPAGGPSGTYAYAYADSHAESHSAGRDSQPDTDTFALTQPDANAQAYSNTNAHPAGTDANAHPVGTDANAHPDSNAHAFTRSVAEPDAQFHASANSNAGPHTGAHSYADSDDVCPDADCTSAVVRAAQPGADLHRHSYPHRRADPDAAALRHLACNLPVSQEPLRPGPDHPPRTGNTQPRPVPWAVGNEAPAWTTT